MAHDSRGTSPPTPLWRFTLRQFLIAIAFIGLGCVALRSASSWWASAMLGLTLFVLTASLLLVVYRRDADRAWWAGFATFGWAYLLLLFLGWTVNAVPLRTSSLITHKLSQAAHEWLFSEAPATAMSGPDGRRFGGYGGYSSYGTSNGGYGGMESGMPGGDMVGGYGTSMPGAVDPFGASSGYGGIAPTPAPAFSPPSKEHFTNVAHPIWALVLAFCGGWLARAIYATQPRRESTAAP